MPLIINSKTAASYASQQPKSLAKLRFGNNPTASVSNVSPEKQEEARRSSWRKILQRLWKNPIKTLATLTVAFLSLKWLLNPRR